MNTNPAPYDSRAGRAQDLEGLLLRKHHEAENALVFFARVHSLSVSLLAAAVGTLRLERELGVGASIDLPSRNSDIPIRGNHVAAGIHTTAIPVDGVQTIYRRNHHDAAVGVVFEVEFVGRILPTLDVDVPTVEHFSDRLAINKHASLVVS
jgi:hypothetical protein